MGVGRLKLHEGKLEEFKRLAAQVVETARTLDTGTLQYDIFLSDDESECIIIERYRDSDALLEHAAHVGELMPQIFATGSGTSEMLGEPSAEIRAQIAGGAVRLFTPFLWLGQGDLTGS
jgi:quinol monooxygenase YgiN